MTSGIRAAQILRGFRGQPPADVEALTGCLLRVSQLAVEFPELTECDLNPLKVFEEGRGVMAVDVRFALG